MGNEETPPAGEVNLLVTAVGRRVYVVEELVRAAAPENRLFVTDVDPFAPALYVPGAHVLPPAHGGEPLKDWVARLADRHSLHAVLSLHDYEIVQLAEAADALADHGVGFIGPSRTTARLLIDKFAQYAHLRGRGLSGLVPTYTESSWDDPPTENARHGWVVKDRFGSGSSGLTFAPSWHEAVQACRDNRRTPGRDADMQPAPMESVIQPLVAGQEFNVDVFLDRAGEVSGLCVKRKVRMRHGETDAAEVLLDPPPRVAALATEVASHLDVVGNLDVDIIEEPSGAAFVIDLNPRFGGGYAFSARAGYRAADAVWSLAAREDLGRTLGPTRAFSGSKYVGVMPVQPGHADG